MLHARAIVLVQTEVDLQSSIKKESNTVFLIAITNYKHNVKLNTIHRLIVPSIKITSFQYFLQLY